MVVAAQSALAETRYIYGTAVEASTQVFSIVRSPVNQCTTEKRPVYKNNRGNGSIDEFLKGAIIGGIIGNNVGNVDGGGALGAILGGAIANESHKDKNSTTEIVGYKEYLTCREVYEETERHAGWKTIIEVGGVTIARITEIKYAKGQRVRIKVNFEG